MNLPFLIPGLPGCHSAIPNILIQVCIFLLWINSFPQARVAFFFISVIKNTYLFIFKPVMWSAGSQFSDQGLNLCSLDREQGVLTTGQPGKSLKFLCKIQLRDHYCATDILDWMAVCSVHWTMFIPILPLTYQIPAGPLPSTQSWHQKHLLEGKLPKVRTTVLDHMFVFPCSLSHGYQIASEFNLIQLLLLAL